MTQTKKVPFNVSARAGKLLGRENFSNAEGAVIELVKNSYDADAQSCIVIFDIPFRIEKDEEGQEIKVPISREGQIFIIDNGEGMTDKIITNQWMMIGTGNKETDHTSVQKRVKTGAKGIGRFALDRLGYTAEMWTLPKENQDNNGFKWGMDWKQFDDYDRSISQITADLQEMKVNFESIINENLKIEPLLQDMLKSGDYGCGTILRITDLKDLWFDDDVDDVFKSLEALIPPKELNIPFQVIFRHFQRGKEFGNVETAFFNDYDYKLTAEYDATKLSVDFEITRNELDLDLVKKNFSGLYKTAKAPFDLATIEKKKFKYSKPVDKLLKWDLTEKNKGLLQDVGSFNLTFYYLKFSASRKENYPYKSVNARERKNVLDKFGGVKIYRDSFRVRPYGDPSNDWLKLGARVAQSPAGAGQRIGDWRVRPEQTAGIITISRNTNPLLVDKSDRGSLQENDVYDVFRTMIIQVIHEFEVDRSRVLNVYYKHFEVQKKLEWEKEIDRRAQQLADRIIEERKNTERKIYGNLKQVPDLFAAQKEQEEKKAYEEAFKSTLKEIEDEHLERTNEEIVQVRGLASLGLIMSSFAHELKQVRNNAVEIKRLENTYKSLIPKDEKYRIDYDEGADTVQLLLDDADKIKHWIDYSLTAIKKDKRKRGKLDFSAYVGALNKVWKKIFTMMDIQLVIKDVTKDIDYTFKAFEMDMDTIFTNLINNSIDSFNNLKAVQERIITISLKIVESDIYLTYSDNGTGIPKVFGDKDEIFLPFITSKTDRKGNAIGTGLGMYLIKNVVDDNNGTVEILNPDSGFGLLITFPIKKN